MVEGGIFCGTVREDEAADAEGMGMGFGLACMGAVMGGGPPRCMYCCWRWIIGFCWGSLERILGRAPVGCRCEAGSRQLVVV